MKPASLPRAAPNTLAYLRVSTDEQAAHDRTSLRDQEAAIAALATKLGRTVDQRFADAGKSGATAEGRPAFVALVRYCETHPRTAASPGYVLVLNDSRWGRFHDPEEATYWRVALKRWGWIVRFAEGDDVEDRTARSVLRTIHSAQATQYREQLQANCRRGMKGGIAQGFWMREAPLGYRREACDMKTGAKRVLDVGQRKTDHERVRLVPGPPAEQALVRWMFTAYLHTDMTTRALMRELRLRAPGLRRWSRPVVRQILRCRTFLGESHWAPDYAAPEQHLTIPNTHQALITSEVFDQVQAMLAHRHKTLRRSVGYALTGLLTCAACGEPYVGGGGKQAGPGEDPDRHKFYRCRGRDEGRGQGVTCPGHGVVMKGTLERIVLAAIVKQVATPAAQQAIARAIDRLLTTADTREDPARAIRAVDQERERLVHAISQGVLTPEEAAPAMQRVRRQLEQLATTRDQRRFASRRSQALGSERERLLALARDFPTQAARLRGRALQEVIRPWLATGVVDLVARTVTVRLNVVPREPALALHHRSDNSGGPKLSLQNWPTVTRVLSLARKSA